MSSEGARVSANSLCRQQTSSNRLKSTPNNSNLSQNVSLSCPFSLFFFISLVNSSFGKASLLRQALPMQPSALHRHLGTIPAGQVDGTLQRAAQLLDNLQVLLQCHLCKLQVIQLLLDSTFLCIYIILPERRERKPGSCRGAENRPWSKQASKEARMVGREQSSARRYGWAGSKAGASLPALV